MKKILLLLFLFCVVLSINTFAIPANATLQSHELKIDTLKLHSLHKPALKTWYESGAMPWLITLLVAILTLAVNWLMAHAQRKITLKVAKEQFETSINIAVMQFQSNLNANNRQEWINEVRNSISDLVTQARMLNIEFHEQPRNQDKIKGYDEKLHYYYSKLKLFLSGHLPSHGEFLQAMKEFIAIMELQLLSNSIDDIKSRNFELSNQRDVVIEKGNHLLYTEWQKIQDAIKVN